MASGFIKNIEKLLTTQYQYIRYYFCNMLTMLKILDDKITKRGYNMSEHSITNIFRIFEILEERRNDFVDRQLPYSLLEGITSQIERLLKQIIEDICNESNSKNIRLKSEPIFNEYYKLLSPKHETYKQIDGLNHKVTELKKLYNQKGIVVHLKIKNQIANIFWMLTLNCNYIVHVNDVWKLLHNFLKKYNIYSFFVSEFNEKNIVERLDSKQQYFISANNITQVFQDFIEPKQISKFFEETTITKSVNIVNQKRLKRNLKIRFKCKTDLTTNLKNNQFVLINSDCIELMSSNTKVKNKYFYVTRFGRNAQSSQIELGHKSISRNQFIIVCNQYQEYFVVCTSPSNPTRIRCNYMVEITVGMMIKVGEHEVLTFMKIQEIEEKQLIPLEMTTTMDKTVVTNNQTGKVKINKFMKLTLEISHGKFKGDIVELKANYDDTEYLIGPDEGCKIYSSQKSRIFFKNKLFLVDRGTELILKNSYEYVNRCPSTKRVLKEGEIIYAEQYEFQILN